MRLDDVLPHRPLFRLVARPEIPRRGRERVFDDREVREFWADEFGDAAFGLEELYPLRVKVLWRITRELAWRRGYLQSADVTLREATSRIKPDPWRLPVPSTATAPRETPPMSLLAPADDERLRDYVRELDAAARKLHVSGTRVGQLGLRGLLDVSTVREALDGITPEILCEFEGVMVEDALHVIVEPGVGAASAVRKLQEIHGVTQDEARQLVALARRVAPDYAPPDRETDRALMILTLDSFLAQIREEAPLDHRLRLQAIRLKAVIQGLWSKDDSTLDSELSDVVERLSQDPPAPLPPPSGMLESDSQ